MHAVSDLVIRIKNGYKAHREQIVSPHSILRVSILEKLKKLGYIRDYHVEGETVKKITIELSFNEGIPAFTGVKIYSKPGRRWYVSYRELQPVLSGLGYSFVSTPKGIMTNIEARKKNIGGELLFAIW